MPYLFRCRTCHGTPVPEVPLGKCTSCHRFSRFERVNVPLGEQGATFQPVKDGEPISVADLMASADGDEDLEKRPTGLVGVDWIFEGGAPRFGTILLGAKRGSGKTTFLFELFSSISESGAETLLISSEQSLKGMKRQFVRCEKRPHNMIIHCERDKDSIIDTIVKSKAEIVALDSLHRVCNITDESGYEMANGTPHAVERVAGEIYEIAEETKKLIWLIGHLTMDGSVAGGAHLQHVVDAVLKISWSGDKKDKRRILEFDGKNRFGEIERRALFMMGDTGLKDCGPVPDEDNFNEAEMKKFMDLNKNKLKN